MFSNRVDEIAQDYASRLLQNVLFSGEPGPQGLAGFAGDKGAKGQPGPEGQSVRGPQGSKGVPGLQGADGLPGPPGMPGMDGLNGLDGMKGQKVDDKVFNQKESTLATLKRRSSCGVRFDRPRNRTRNLPHR